MNNQDDMGLSEVSASKFLHSHTDLTNAQHGL